MLISVKDRVCCPFVVAKSVTSLCDYQINSQHTAISAKHFLLSEDSSSPSNIVAINNIFFYLVAFGDDELIEFLFPLFLKIKLYEIFETPSQINMILELVNGGELFER